MPELPEAETIRRQLAERVAGRRIERVTVNLPAAVSEHDSPEEFVSLVQGRTIADVARRGKAVVFLLNHVNPVNPVHSSNRMMRRQDSHDSHVNPVHSSEGAERPLALICRLGMTGRLLMRTPEEPEEKHTHVVLGLSGGLDVRYVDPRKFGMMVARAGHDLDRTPEFAQYGPDALSEEFTPQYLYQALQGRRVVVELALMDQHLVAGIGKIYSDEACFGARVRPDRPANSLTLRGCRRLHQAIHQVLRDSIAARGTTIADGTYVDAEGQPGEFRFQLAVYGRAGQPCPTCGTPVERKNIQGRGMHWCPRCQK